MTSAFSKQTEADSRRQNAAPADFVLNANARVAIAVAIGFAASLALSWPKVRDIWASGNFYDSDDAMRMVQVRDFIAGQGWFDLNAWRLDPPQGSFMHWSRLVDLPIAALIKLFSPFSGAEAAERLARIVFPLGLQIGLLASVAWLARVLMGVRAIAPAVALAVLSGFMFTQFIPGRVDHHAPQIILLVLMLASMLAALDPARARLAAVAGLCAALSLSISVENLAFIMMLFAAPPIAWMVVGAPMRPVLAWFAGGLAISTLACFAVFNPPARWFIPACDAFSYAHLLAALGAAAVSGAMALAPAGILTRRVAFGVAAGLLVGAPLAFSFANCLIDPFAGLDPLVRDIWLNNVGEARPALKHFALYPRSIQTVALPVLIGLIGICLAIRFERGITRARFVLLLAFALLGCATTAFMIRASTSLAPVALMGCAWIAVQVSQRLAARNWNSAGILGLVLFATLPMSSIGWSMAPTLSPTRAEPAENLASCLLADDFAPLAKLPPGLVLAPIEMGAHILAHTPHSVIAAPYHRNNRGNRLAIDALMAPPERARDMIVASGARYLVACPQSKMLALIAARAPNGLAAMLIKGEAPAGLRQVHVAATPLNIYKLD